MPGERLEHTGGSYLLAIEQGVDFIEPDVVATRDGVLVVRHENEISGTTDVADRPELADRKRTRVVDGVPLTGWFTEDLTLDEVKSLRARERLPQLRPHNATLAGTEPVLTFAEVLQIAAEADREVGVYVETKHPTYFAGLGLDLDDLLLADLAAAGMDHADASVVIQSMETSNLRALRGRTPLPLVQLVDRKGAPFDLLDAGDPRDYAALTRPEQLADIATYADGIGANKSLVIARDPQHHLVGETDLVHDAHDVGLAVHVWTMRSENNFLPMGLRSSADKAAHGDAAGEYLAFYGAGVDGVFSDFAATAVAARAAFVSRKAAAAPA